TELLQINSEEHNARKKVFSERIDKMIDYIKERNLCRSKLIGNYFGDAAMTDCGICDNCLQKKKAALSQETFDKISESLTQLLRAPLSIEEMLGQLKMYPKEHIWTVINFWVDEGKLTMENNGTVVLNS